MKSTSNFKHFEKKDDSHSLAISKLLTAKHVVRWLSNKRSFSTLFDSQHDKGFQLLLKSARQHFYNICF